MKKSILILTLVIATYSVMGQAGPCNATLVGTNTTVISSTMLMDSASSTSAQNNILICGGNTLTYNWVLAKDFYVQSGATLILKSAQIAKIYLESGASLVFDTSGQTFAGTIINGITYDSTNVTFTDTNQFYISTSAIYWNHCLGNTFNYTVFSPATPCTPLDIDNSLKAVLDVSFTNPVSDVIQFHSLVKDQISSVQIFDISGKVIRSYQLESEYLDVSYLPKGIYLMQIRNKKGEKLMKKFLKN